MRYVLAIWVIIVLVFLFLFSVFSMAGSGVSGFILAVLSGVGLYRVIRFMYNGYNSDGAREERSMDCDRAAGPSDPLEFLIFYDLKEDIGNDEWDDY